MAKFTIETQADRDAAAKAALRTERNQRLRETDWVMLSDCPLNKKEIEAVVEYRQALRGFPAIEKDAADPDWPAPPPDPDFSRWPHASKRHGRRGKHGEK